MRIKYFESLLLIVSLLFSTTSFSQEDIDDVKYFSTDIVSRIKDPAYNLNLYYASDYLVTIEQYDMWSEINYDNYGEINEPFVDRWDDRDIVVIDSTTFYYAIKSDTVFIEQEVFTDNIEGKIVKIIPIENKKDTKFKLSVAVDETITQFLPLEEYGRDNMEDQIADLEIWERASPYKAIKDSAQFYFLIPDRDSISDIEQIKVDLALADTTLYYEAEGGGHDVNYIYKGKPAEHRIRAMIIRIDKFERDVLIETRYIQCRFPEAC